MTEYDPFSFHFISLFFPFDFLPSPHSSTALDTLSSVPCSSIPFLGHCLLSSAAMHGRFPLVQCTRGRRNSHARSFFSSLPEPFTLGQVTRRFRAKCPLMTRLRIPFLGTTEPPDKERAKPRAGLLQMGKRDRRGEAAATREEASSHLFGAPLPSSSSLINTVAPTPYPRPPPPYTPAALFTRLSHWRLQPYKKDRSQPWAEAANYI